MDNCNYPAGSDTSRAPWNDRGPTCPDCGAATEDEERKDDRCIECGMDHDDMIRERDAADLEHKWEEEREIRETCGY